MPINFWRGEIHRLRDLDFLTAGKSYCLRTRRLLPRNDNLFHVVIAYLIYRLAKTAVNIDDNNTELHYICKTMSVNVRIHL